MRSGLAFGEANFLHSLSDLHHLGALKPYQLLFVHGPPRLRVKELRLVQISSGAALLLSLGVAVSPFMATASQSVIVLLAASSLHLLGGIMIPVIRALISHSTSPDRQGQVRVRV